MMHNSSMPDSIASSPMIWMTGLVSPSRSTRGNISFCTAVEAGYWRVPRPAAVITALRTLAMTMGRYENAEGATIPDGFDESALCVAHSALARGGKKVWADLFSQLALRPT